MLSERITALFALLQCGNTDIARYAGCSSANISKLKTGYRNPRPTSPSVMHLVNGVYGYADYENMLGLLAELCGTMDTSRESIIPALIGWLFESRDIALPRSTATPKSKRTQSYRLQRFGEKLDEAMTLLEISNGQLAAALNIDASLVSRYRSGVYSPLRNERLSEALSAVLLSRARKRGKTDEFAALCGTDASGLDGDTVAEWLFNSTAEEDSAAIAQRLLESLDNFIPGHGLPASAPEVPELPPASRYVGTEGLRAAVVRFLSEAAREGGELLLYSDEPMEWMSGDKAYFALWASLMVKCIKNGVRIKIIHNVDREGDEMVDAITGWIPLYISGMIEPYVFRPERAPRFHHTMFLRADASCIRGFFPVGAYSERSYDYITEKEQLDRIKGEYDAMLSAASPFMEIYTPDMQEEFHRNWIDFRGIQDHLLTEFPLVTMPEELLRRILSRTDTTDERREFVLSRYHDLRGQFEETLRSDSFNMIFCLPSENDSNSRYINSSLSLTGFDIAYTEEEYSEHISAIIKLVEQEKNFHLTLLPLSPFKEIQIITRNNAVAVLRCREPYAAFVFLNPDLRHSVSAYFSTLATRYTEDRSRVIDTLKRLK